MQKPEFNDEFEKTRIRKHKTFGGKVVEILYGAKDADGNPTVPSEDKDDGHGRWFGIEVNGDYRMFVWTHSKDEGGETEYGTEYKDDALNVMEEQLQKKWDLVKEAEQISRNLQNEEEGDRLAEIRREYDALKDWDTPVEKDRDGYDARLKNAEDELSPRLEAIRNNGEQKKALVEKAEALKNAENFRDARNQLADLRDQLGEIGSAGSEADAQFRKQLNDIDHLLRDRQKEYIANRDANFAKAEETKKEIIARTKEIVANFTNYRQTSDQLNNLFNEWKAAGNAGRDVDEKLWKEFNDARQVFYDARAKFMEERKQQFDAAAEAKKKLIEEAKDLAGKNDYSRKITDRMKQLDVEWKAAGSAGHKTDETLWQEFNTAKEVFWNGKQAEFRKVLETDLEKKQEELDSLTKMNEDLEYRAEIAPSAVMRDDSERQLAMNEDRIDRLQSEIEDLQRRIAE